MRKKNNKLIVFVFLLIVYYIVNIITSTANSGMSGGLQASHNIFNQISIGVIVVYMLYKLVFKYVGFNTISEVFILLLIFYIALRELFIIWGNYRLFLSNQSSFFLVLFWGIGFLFCMECYRTVDKRVVDKYLILLILVYLFYVTYRTITQKILLKDAEIIAGINVAGSIYMIVPLILLTIKGKWRIILFLFCWGISVFSAKRQAVAGMAIVSLFSFIDLLSVFIYKNRIKGLLVLFIAITVFYIYQEPIISIANDLLERNEYIEESGISIDSGRESLRNGAITGFLNADLFNQLFGGGTGQGLRYNAQIIFNPRAPHNGFIEILCDYGIIALLLYASFVLSLLYYSNKIKEKRYRYISYSIVAAFVFCNLISHATNLNYIYLFISYGYVYSKSLEEHKTKKQLQHSYEKNQ